VDVDPDQIVCHNFKPYSDKALTLEILKKTLAQIELELTPSGPKTDRELTTLAKKKSLVESAIAAFSASEYPSPTPRRDQRVGKKLRRKAMRFDQGRK